MQKISTLFLCCLLLLLDTACIKELNFELGQSDDVLVVYGIFSDQAGRHLFRVTRTNPFDRQVDTQPVSGAELNIVDAKGKAYPFVELEPGSYLFKDTLYRAKTGEQYYLSIKLPNGEAYRSELEVMPSPVKLNGITVRNFVKENDEELRVFAEAQIPAAEEGVYLRWDVARVWRRTSIDFAFILRNPFLPPPDVCYMREDPEPNSARLFSSRRRDAFVLREQEVAIIPADYKFYERNAIEVIQYRISEQAHRYWSDLNAVGNPAGTIFDVPPASVPGNIYNVKDSNLRILGYFELAAVDTAHISFERNVLRYNINDPCLVDYTKPQWAATYYYSPECAYCVNIEGYSKIMPTFFWK